MEAEPNVRKDSLCVSMLGISGVFTKEAYTFEQESIKGKVRYKRDPITHSIILVPDFVNVLNKIQCPVLAIFGGKEFIVDWRKTKMLYNETIRRNNNNRLTIKTFPEGNHGIVKCKTGSLKGKMDKLEFCGGYLETMTTWLKENGFGK